MPRRRPSAPVVFAATVGIAVAASVAWRLAFADLPITTDEAGFMVVARLWAHGARLYQSIWVDRPQGLLLVFRLVAHVDHGSLDAIRAAAVVAGALLVLLVAAAARELGGSRIGAIAALLAGALGCSPFIESFTLSGELLAAIPATAAAVCGARWLRGRGDRWLIAAGLLGGSAVMVKQSAFDSVVALAIVVALGLGHGHRRLRPLVQLAAASLLPVVVAAAAATSFAQWWFAVVGYRETGDSLLTGSAALRWHQFLESLPALENGLAPLLVVALIGVVSRAPAYARLWLACAVVGVLGGGQFHAHYYIQLVAPLAVCGAFGVERVARRSRWALLAVPAIGATAFALATTAPLLSDSTAQRIAILFPQDPHLAGDAAVAARIRRIGRSGSLLVIPQTASLYYLTARRPALTYLWTRNLATIPAAGREERAALASARAAVVAVRGAVETGLRHLLHRRYRRVADVRGTLLFERRGEPGRRAVQPSGCAESSASCSSR